MTPTQLETELREALFARAAVLSPDASARLRRIDYHPRSRRIRPQLAVGVAAGTAGTAGAIAAIVGLTTATSNAFAGWTARPTSASRAQIASAEAACRGRLAHAPAPPAPPSGAKQPAFAPAHLPARLVDTRGPFTFVIFANARDSASCITGPGFVSLSGTHTTGRHAVPADLVVLSVSHTSRDGHPYSFAEGHAGANVTAAALELSGGRTVQATVAHGWFVAWWPGDNDVTAIRVTTPSGTRTQKFTGALAPPPATSTARSSISGSLSTGGRGKGGAVVQSQTISHGGR